MDKGAGLVTANDYCPLSLENNQWLSESINWGGLVKNKYML